MRYRGAIRDFRRLPTPCSNLAQKPDCIFFRDVCVFAGITLAVAGLYSAGFSVVALVIIAVVLNFKLKRLASCVRTFDQKASVAWPLSNQEGVCCCQVTKRQSYQHPLPVRAVPRVKATRYQGYEELQADRDPAKHMNEDGDMPTFTHKFRVRCVVGLRSCDPQHSIVRALCQWSRFSRPTEPTAVLILETCRSKNGHSIHETTKISAWLTSIEGLVTLKPAAS